MSVRNRFALLLALSTLLLLAACGSSGNVNPTPPPSGSFSNADLSGTYVFSVSGTDVNGLPYAIVGAFTANGKAGITGGTVDINDGSFVEVASPTIPPVANAQIHGNSFYSVSVDGRGQATLGTDTPFGNITLDFVLASSSGGRVSEFDANGSGSGSLDLQSASLTQSSLAGPYALSFAGLDGSGTGFLATAGAFTLDESGNISSGVTDSNDNGLIPILNQSLTGQVILGPSSTPATLLISSSGQTYDVYAVDSTHLKFIEMDPLPILSGDAFSQPTASISGTLAFALSGAIEGNAAATGGFMVTDGGGNILSASTEDINIAGTTGFVPSFTATYTDVGSLVPGRFTLNNFVDFTGGTQYAAYPSSGGLLLLEVDSLGIMSGAAFPQSSTNFASAEGYGLNLQGISIIDGPEVDDIAEFTATSGGGVQGIIDENFAPGGVPTFGMALVGTYGAIDGTGRYGLSAAAGNSTTTTLNGGFNLIFYGVDGNNFPFIESDGGQVASGVIVLQTPSDPALGGVRSHMFVPRPFVSPHVIRPKKNKK